MGIWFRLFPLLIVNLFFINSYAAVKMNFNYHSFSLVLDPSKFETAPRNQHFYSDGDPVRYTAEADAGQSTIVFSRRESNKLAPEKIIISSISKSQILITIPGRNYGVLVELVDTTKARNPVNFGFREMLRYMAVATDDVSSEHFNVISAMTSQPLMRIISSSDHSNTEVGATAVAFDRELLVPVLPRIGPVNNRGCPEHAVVYSPIVSHPTNFRPHRGTSVTIWGQSPRTHNIHCGDWRMPPAVNTVFSGSTFDGSGGSNVFLGESRVTNHLYVRTRVLGREDADRLFERRIVDTTLAELDIDIFTATADSSIPQVSRLNAISRDGERIEPNALTEQEITHRLLRSSPPNTREAPHFPLYQNFINHFLNSDNTASNVWEDSTSRFAAFLKLYLRESAITAFLLCILHASDTKNH